MYSYFSGMIHLGGAIHLPDFALTGVEAQRIKMRSEWMAPLSFYTFPNLEPSWENSCARHGFRVKTMNSNLSKVRDRRLRKRLPIGLFLPFFALLFLTSCYNTRFIEYNIETRDAKSKQIATVEKNDFSVIYPNFAVHYYANGKQEAAMFTASGLGIFREPNNYCEIENYSDSIMVIDLSTSYRNNERLYRNEITTNTYTNSHTSGLGTTINMGNVAAALGAGLRLTTIASGINVGGNNSNTTTNTTQVQTIPDQYIVIPPNGTATIPCYAYYAPNYNTNAEFSREFSRRMGNHTDKVGMEILNMAVSYAFLPSNVDSNFAPKFQVYQHRIVIDSERVFAGNTAFKQSGNYPKNRYVDQQRSVFWWCGWGIVMVVCIGGSIAMLCSL